MYNKDRYFYFLSLILVVSTFLPLLVNNLPFILQKHYGYAALWLISLLVFKPSVFIEKLMLFVILYGLFLISMYKISWFQMDEWNVNFLIKEYFQIFVGSSVVSYYINSKDFENFARLSRWCLIFLVITALMSIFSSFLDPMYARNLISSEVDEGEYANETFND